MNSVEKIVLRFAFVLVFAFALAGCKESPTDNPDAGGDIWPLTDITVQSTVRCSIGDVKTIRVRGAKMTDVLTLENGDVKLEQVITDVSETWLQYEVQSGVESGTYDFVVTRGDKSQTLFTADVFVTLNTQVPDKEGMNLKGMVFCEDAGVPDVLVTDGVQFTKTDENGYYWLNSTKVYQTVYLILPSGYKVKSTAAMPQFWATTDSDTSVCEQNNFELEVENNDAHTLLIATDIHLANRDKMPKDTKQFSEGWVKDVTDNFKNSSVPVYCFNLGDFAWDVYWYDRSFDLDDAAMAVSSLPFQFWSTMGNHDNDGRTPAGDDVDMRASAPFRSIIGPTHLSLNIGKIHYILLDDILYINTFPSSNNDPLMGQRNYSAGFRDDIMEWVRQDLSYVDKSTPIVVGMHIPLMNAYGTSRNGEFWDASEWSAFLDMFNGYTEVEFVSGHTHVNRMRPVVGYSSNMYEHNIGAVCGIWWNTSEHSGGTTSTPGKLNMCSDGAPSGYYVYDVNGTNRRWHYKAVGEPKDKQFKSYDMNEVKKYFQTDALASKFINAGQCPNSDSSGGTITWTASAYGAEEEANTVWINVWGYEKGDFAGYGNWTITVTENGKELPVSEKFYVHDPLSAMTYEIQEFGSSGKFSTSSQSRSYVPHMFKVVASSASSTLKIKVVDRFGNIYQEDMNRPKVFYDANDKEASWTLD